MFKVKSERNGIECLNRKSVACAADVADDGDRVVQKRRVLDHFRNIISTYFSHIFFLFMSYTYIIGIITSIGWNARTSIQNNENLKVVVV